MGSWTIKPLGEVCHVIGGGTPPKDRPEYYDGEIPWATVRDMRADIIERTEFTITRAAVEASATNVIPARNVVIATRVGLGKVCLIERPTAINQDLRGVIPRDPQQLEVKFLFWWLKSVAHLIEKEGTGATVQGVKLPFIKSLGLPLPPLPEQRRIVAILDDAFEAIATAKANTVKNLQNARELPAVFMRRSLATGADSWTESTIGEQVTLQRGFDITKDLQRDGSVPVVSSGGVRSYHDTHMVRAPGVVMGRKGTLGKVFFLEEDFWPHDTTLWVKDFKGNDPRFVYRFFAVLEVKGLDSGAANPALNRNQVHALCVLWPPLDDQVALAERIERISAGADQLASTYAAKLAALDELKKSLLHQAFTGQLTAKSTDQQLGAAA